MKALIFSDSHGRTENLVKAMDRHPDFQAIFHLGDVGNDEAYIRSLTPYPVYMVRGNCDFSSSLKESMVIEFGGKRIAMCHGHRYLSYGGAPDALRCFGLQNHADVVMFGHTHVPYLERNKDITLLNPGSISYPRQDGRKHTFMMIDVDKDGEFHYSQGLLKSSFRGFYGNFY